LRKRILAIRAVVTVLSAVGVLAFGPVAKADPPVIQPPTQVGHNSGIFRNPNNSAQFVRWAVAIDLGNTDADAAKEFFSPVGRVSEGAGVLRSQVVNERAGIGARIINDYFPSKDATARNNTPSGCRTGPYDPAPPGGNVFLDLFDVRASDADGICDSAADKVKNALNSSADYEPDVSLVRGFGDWLPTAATECPTAKARVFFEVRFDDGSVHAFNAATPSVNSDGPGCP
jgi:hypothetical protein